MSGTPNPNCPSRHLLVPKDALIRWLRPMLLMVLEINTSHQYRALELLAVPKLRADLLCEEVDEAHPLCSAVERIDIMYSDDAFLIRRTRLIEFATLLLRDVMHDALA